MMLINLIAGFAIIAIVSGQNSGSFWHVTDFHYDPTYTTTGKSCHDVTDVSKLGSYGDYKCDSPWSLITDAVNAMKTIEPNADFVLWSGDATPHVPNDQLSENRVLEIMTNLTSLLKDTFQNTPVYAVLGNHDYHPKNQLPASSNNIYQKLWEQWGLWVTDAAAKTSFNKGGYYTTILSPGLRIVVLNTVLYYQSNTLTPSLNDPADQFKWFDDLMTNSANRKEKVFLAAHLPPGVEEKHTFWPWMPTVFNSRLEQLIVKHSSTLAGLFFGHHHTDALRMFYDKTGKPVATGLIAPAVTPWERTIPNGIGTLSQNPGIRLIKYDKTTFHVQDVHQYFLDLKAANAAGTAKPTWKLEYKATSAYGISDMKPATVDALVKSFKTDGAKFQKYINYNSVSYKPDESCTGTCKAAQYCAATNIGREKYRDCFLEMTPPPPTTPTPTTDKSWTLNTRGWSTVLLSIVLSAVSALNL